MKQFQDVTSAIRENAAVARAGYGKGFWTLIFGLGLAVSIVYKMDTSRTHPVVERIPASEVAATTK